MISETDASRALGAVMAAVPELTDFGFGVWPGSDFETERQALREGLDGVKRAMDWLRRQTFTKRPNRRRSSYGLKHVAEREIGYTTNGQFIAAAIIVGAPIKRCAPDSPNAWIGISARSLALAAISARSVAP